MVNHVIITYILLSLKRHCRFLSASQLTVYASLNRTYKKFNEYLPEAIIRGGGGRWNVRPRHYELYNIEHRRYLILRLKPGDK